MGVLWDSHYDGISRLIDINPVKISWRRWPLIDNGYGATVNDTSAEPEELSAWVRISQNKGGVQGAVTAAAGITTEQSMFMLALYDVDLREGDIAAAEAGAIRKWKIGVVEELSVEGECYAKQAQLLRADG